MNRENKHLANRPLPSLLAEIAGLGSSPNPKDDPQEIPTRSEVRTDLGRARRRAHFVVLLDWAAILILIGARAHGNQTAVPVSGLDLLLGVGMIAIAVHSGLRLGQAQNLSALLRILEDDEEDR